MKNILVSMTDFVLEQELINGGFGQDEINKVWNYVNFLKQPLELYMFVPCKLVDGVWVVLEEPKYFKIDNSDFNNFNYADYCLEYQQAKERVLFEGFRLNGKYLWMEESLFMISDNYTESLKNYGNIESLLKKYLPKNIQLTATAQKQIGL